MLLPVSSSADNQRKRFVLAPGTTSNSTNGWVPNQAGVDAGRSLPDPYIFTSVTVSPCTLVDKPGSDASPAAGKATCLNSPRLSGGKSRSCQNSTRSFQGPATGS